ncbi:MAG TPA: GDSL-type esterase/lipase family protein, partial [Isosphaeraceae bacterium]|nr:GDSL-type esterase/lipase family protein [Isosphaeraceae bacterium]
RAIELVRARRGGPDAATAVRRRLRPLRYELEPGAGLPANGEVAKINGAGLRGAEPETPKRRTRVLCLGDSVTFGYAPGVTDDATYPADLARRLDPARFEVINGGMPAFGSLDCLDFLLYKGLALEPDVVVILAGWNDFNHAHQVDERPPAVSPLHVLERSALVRLGKLVVARLVGPRPTPFDPARERARLASLPAPGGRLSDAAFASTGRAIEAMVRACRDHHAVPVLVTYPNFTRDGWDGVDSLADAELRPALSALAEIELSPGALRTYAVTTNRLIREAAARLDVPLVEGDAIRDPGLFFDMIHLGPEGNAMLADRVAPAVVRAIDAKKALTHGGP